MSAPVRRKNRRFAKLVLVACSLGGALLLMEVVLRVTGHYRLFSLRLEQPTAAADPGAMLDLAPEVVEPFVQRYRQRRPDLDPAWLRTSPGPLPRPPALDKPARPQLEWLFHYYVLNGVLLRAMWVKGQGLPMFPGIELPEQFAVFAPPGGKPTPRYRYPASCTLPNGLVTNAFGFRGRELAVDKPPRTVRIGFVGASTTVEAARLPHSAPELIEHWLSLWAMAQHLDVRFETLNAAREAIESPDLRAIVEDELLPLAVDYVVYYEGANQFQPATLRKHVRIEAEHWPPGSNAPIQLAAPPPGLVGTYDEAQGVDATWLDGLAVWSASARYLRSALQRGERLAEPDKPPQRITLAAELMGPEFSLGRAGEVLECGAIAQDLQAIRAAVEAGHGKFVLSTFWWLAEDGMRLDPVWGRNVHVHLNRAYWPFRYATVRDLAAVQNRFFASWARAAGVDLLDVAGELPHDERLAIDAIHHNELGVRLKAWVMFAQLTTILARDLASGALPRADDHPDARHPVLGPPTTVTRAELDAGR